MNSRFVAHNCATYALKFSRVWTHTRFSCHLGLPGLNMNAAPMSISRRKSRSRCSAWKFLDCELLKKSAPCRTFSEERPRHECYPHHVAAGLKGKKAMWRSEIPIPGLASAIVPTLSQTLQTKVMFWTNHLKFTPCMRRVRRDFNRFAYVCVSSPRVKSIHPVLQL